MRSVHIGGAIVIDVEQVAGAEGEIAVGMGT